MPLLPCPHCDQSVQVSISQAGSEITCPGCQSVVSVPKLGELKRIAADAVARGHSASPPVMPNSVSDDQAGRRVLFGGVLAIAGIAAVVGLFCLVRYLSVEVPANTEMHIAEVDRLYHQSPAAELVREWEQMEKFNLEASGPYTYKKLEREKARWARNSLIAGSVLAIALVGAVGLAFSDRKRRVTA